MPYVTFSPRGEAFLSAVGRFGWVTPGFDWPAWARTPDARELMDSPDRMGRATPDDLAHVLTALVRADRFGEGELLGAHESGLLIRVCRRASVLAGEVPGPSQAPGGR
jgi:hypothetical protein